MGGLAPGGEGSAAEAGGSSRRAMANRPPRSPPHDADESDEDTILRLYKKVLADNERGTERAAALRTRLRSAVEKASFVLGGTDSKSSQMVLAPADFSTMSKRTIDKFMQAMGFRLHDRRDLPYVSNCEPNENEKESDEAPPLPRDFAGEPRRSATWEMYVAETFFGRLAAPPTAVTPRYKRQSQAAFLKLAEVAAGPGKAVEFVQDALNQHLKSGAALEKRKRKRKRTD